MSTSSDPLDILVVTQVPTSSDGVIDASTCNDVANNIWSPEPFYDFASFSNTPAIIVAHNGIPRGLHSNDILHLIMGTQEEGQDYIWGLFLSSLIVLIFFASWITLLIFLKCLGRQRVGWLSGRRQALPPKPIEPKQQQLQEENSGEATTNEQQQQVYSNPQDSNIEGNHDAFHSVVTGGQESTVSNASTKLHSSTNTTITEMIVLEGPSQAALLEHAGKDVTNETIKEGEEKPGKDEAAVATTTAATATPVLSPAEWNTLYGTKQRQDCWLKGVVIVACATIIAMSIVMVTIGIDSLRGSWRDGKISINYAQVLVDAGAEVVDDLSSLLSRFQSDMLSLLQQINEGICPNAGSWLCSNINDFTTCNTTNVFGDDENGLALSETFEKLVQVFGSDWKIVSQLEDLEQDLRSMSTTASKAEEQIANIDWVFLVAVVFGVMVGLLALCMIIYLLWPKRHRNKRLPWCVTCFHHRCLFPIFLVMVLFSFIFAIAFLIASLALSDTCADDPDARILEIANYFRGDDNPPYVQEYITYWLSHCEIPPQTIDEDEQLLRNVNDFILKFEEEVIAVNDRLVRVCGTPNPTFFSTLAGTLVGYVCVSVDILWRLKEAFQCSTWLPLYYNTVYNAMCFNGVDGVWAIASTQFLTCFMTCVILTCRCVFFDLESAKGDEPNNDEDNIEEEGKVDATKKNGDDVEQEDDAKEASLKGVDDEQGDFGVAEVENAKEMAGTTSCEEKEKTGRDDDILGND